MTNKNAYAGVLPVFFLTSLALVEWFSWTPQGSYLMHLVSLSVAASFYLAVILLALSAASLAASGLINGLLRGLSFRIWRNRKVLFSLTESTKSTINLIVPCILVIVGIGTLYVFIAEAKASNYVNAMHLIGVIYSCAIALVLSQALVMPEVRRVRFGIGGRPVIRQDVGAPLIYNMPDNGVTYIKSRGENVWHLLQNRYNSVLLTQDDCFICVSADRFFFSDRLIVEGHCYCLTLDLAARPNMEAFPLECYVTSILSLEKFVQYDDAKRIALIRAHLSGIKNIVDKELAAHEGLFVEAIGNAINGNFAGYGADGNMLFEDRHELDAMKLSISSYISNAIMGLKASSAVCDIELSISGFELAGMLKQKVDLLIEGVKHTRQYKEQTDQEILKLVMMHGPAVLSNMASYGIPVNQQSNQYVKGMENAATPASKQLVSTSGCSPQKKAAVANDLKKLGEGITMLELYSLFYRRHIVPEIMPGATDQAVIKYLELHLHSPIEKIQNPESDFYLN